MTLKEDRKDTRGVCFLLLFYLICSVLEFHGPNNGTTLRYCSSLWVQPTNTDIKIIPLQIGLKYKHTQTRSLSQASSTKPHFSHTHRNTHTHCTQSHTHPFTIEYILRKKKTNKQSIINFISYHFSALTLSPLVTGSRLYHDMTVWQMTNKVVTTLNDSFPMIQWIHCMVRKRSSERILSNLHQSKINLHFFISYFNL